MLVDILWVILLGKENAPLYLHYHFCISEQYSHLLIAIPVLGECGRRQGRVLGNNRILQV